MFDWLFTGPYAESRIAALIAPAILAVWMLLRNPKKPPGGKSGTGSGEKS